VSIQVFGQIISRQRKKTCLKGPSKTRTGLSKCLVRKAVTPDEAPGANLVGQGKGEMREEVNDTRWG